MPPHRSASLRAALTPPCPGATARVTSPSAGCPALAAGRRTRRASAPHRSRSCWRRLNRCSQPRRFRPTCGHPAPWLQDVRTYSRTRLWHVREYVRSCPAGLARSVRSQACDRPVANRSRKRQRPGACTLCPSGPCPARPRGRLASPPPFRAPWQCPTWRSHARGGCHQPRSRCPPAGTSPPCLPCSSTF